MLTGMLKLIKCFQPNTLLTTKLLVFFNPYLDTSKCCDKLLVLKHSYLIITKFNAPNSDLKLLPHSFDLGLVKTMPKRSRKVNKQQKDDSASRAKTVHLATLKRKQLDRKCKTLLGIDRKEDEVHFMKKIKKQLVDEPDMSSDSSELDVVYDLQEEKKNRVYEVITVPSDDESNNECSNECNSETKFCTNNEKTDDDIIFIGTVSKVFTKDSIIDSVTKLNPFTKLTDSNYRLPVSNYGYVDSAFNPKIDYMDSVSKPGVRLINYKRIEEVTLSSDSDSCDSLMNINVDSLDVKPGSVKSFSSDTKQESETSVKSFLRDLKQESEASVNNGLKLKIRKTTGMNYGIVNEQGIPDVHSFPPFVLASSSSDNDESSNSSGSSDSVTLFGSGSEASSEDSSDEVPWKKESEDKRNLVEIRYEEQTDLGKKYSSGELTENSDNMIFNLMNFNMLSQYLLLNHKELYWMNDPKTLKWEFRWQLLFEEIQSQKPDILCMQEVEELHLEHYYNRLINLGYNYIFKKRTGVQVDGCAIYYNVSKFELDVYSPLEYFSQGIHCLDRDNIGLVARFKPKKSPEDAIVVATTHLLYNPRRFDVRLAQMQLLLAEIDKLAYNKDTEMYYPVILTGDLNETPNSSVFTLITDGKYKYEGLSHKTLMPSKDYTRMSKVLIPKSKGVTDDCQLVNVLKDRRDKIEVREDIVENLNQSDEASASDSEIISKERFSSGKLTHNLKLTSVYKDLTNYNNGLSKASTQHDTWITVDYIFYSLVENSKTKETEEGSLQLLSKLRLPTQIECKEQIKYLPNYACGSDHLSLSAKFLLHLKVAT